MDKVDKLSSKLSKFFTKKPSSFKGDGHTLGGPSSSQSPIQPVRPTVSSRSEIVSPSNAAQKSAAYSNNTTLSDESRRAAADAALARISKAARPQHGSGSAVSKNLFAQVRQEILREKHSTIKVADGGGLGEDPNVPVGALAGADDVPAVLSVNGIFFKCPIIGVAGAPRDVVMQKIRDFLTEQAVMEPGAAACLMIVSLNRSVRVGTDMPQEVIQACKETLVRYLENILQNPADEKYRKIRIGNRIYQERIAPLEGAELFLTACGFVRCRLPATADNVPQGTEEEYFILDGDIDESCRAHLESLRDALVCVEPILPELDRDVRLFRPTGLVGVQTFNLPDDFYSRTVAEIKNEHEQRTRNLEKSLELRTKEMRERDDQRERRKYRFALIRVRFPILASLSEQNPGQQDEQLILQGTFYAEDKYEQVLKFVAEALADEWQSHQWCLWDPTTRKPLDSATQREAHLCDINLVPAAVLIFKPLSRALPTNAASLFQPELLSKVVDL